MKWVRVLKAEKTWDELSYEEFCNLKTNDQRAVTYLSKNFGVSEYTTKEILETASSTEEAYLEMDRMADRFGYGWDEEEQEDDGKEVVNETGHGKKIGRFIIDTAYMLDDDTAVVYCEPSGDTNGEEYHLEVELHIDEMNKSKDTPAYYNYVYDNYDNFDETFSANDLTEEEKNGFITFLKEFIKSYKEKYQK